jgi:hypothetical protein
MMNAAKLAMTLVLPDAASPDAIPTRLLSAMPMLKKRCGATRSIHACVELLAGVLGGRSVNSSLYTQIEFRNPSIWTQGARFRDALC